MGVMVEVTAKPSRLFALTSFHKLDDLLLSIPVEFLQEAKSADAPVPSWKLKMLVGVETYSICVFGLIETFEILDMLVHYKFRHLLILTTFHF